MKYQLTTIVSKALLILLISIIGLSCVRSKQVAVKKEVTVAKVVKQQDANALLAVAAKAERKYQMGLIDSAIRNNIKAKLTQYTAQQDSLSRAIAFLERASEDRPLFQKSREFVELQRNLIKSFKARYLGRTRRIAMIDTSLDWTTLHSFNLAAFFGPGKYEIPPEKIPFAQKEFSPILDSLVQFYNKYQDIERQATLVILGFADGLGFAPNTDTYKEIATLLGQPEPTKPAMNQKLSEMRADKIGNVMEDLLARRISGYDSVRKVDFVFLETGKGEILPSNVIKDYKTDDERRRVVLFYWNILPK